MVSGRVWPVVGAGHSSGLSLSLACGVRVGLEYRVWPVVGAGHNSGLSLSSVRAGSVWGSTKCGLLSL